MFRAVHAVAGESQPSLRHFRRLDQVGFGLAFASAGLTVVNHLYTFFSMRQLSSETLLQLMLDPRFLWDCGACILLAASSLGTILILVRFLRRDSPLWAYLGLLLSAFSYSMCVTYAALPLIVRFALVAKFAHSTEDFSISVETLADAAYLVDWLAGVGAYVCLGIAFFRSTSRDRLLALLFLADGLVGVCFLFTFKTASPLSDFLFLWVSPYVEIAIWLRAGFWLLRRPHRFMGDPVAATG